MSRCGAGAGAAPPCVALCVWPPSATSMSPSLDTPTALPPGAPIPSQQSCSGPQAWQHLTPPPLQVSSRHCYPSPCYCLCKHSQFQTLRGLENKGQKGLLCSALSIPPLGQGSGGGPGRRNTHRWEVQPSQPCLHSLLHSTIPKFIHSSPVTQSVSHTLWNSQRPRQAPEKTGESAPEALWVHTPQQWLMANVYPRPLWEETRPDGQHPLLSVMQRLLPTMAHFKLHTGYP